jgi:hypothetical protein
MVLTSMNLTLLLVLWAAKDSEDKHTVILNMC